MKKPAFPAVFVLTLAGLSGCPIYDHDDAGCFDHLDCAPGYLCDDTTGVCYAQDDGLACDRPGDCGTNETCDRTGTCVIGDCHFSSVGCVRGYVCSSESGRWECVSEDGTAQGGSSAGGAPSGSAGAPVSSGGEPAASGGAVGDAGSPGASAGQGGEAI